MSDLKNRLITGFIGLLILAFFVYLGGWPLKLAILFVSLGICHELAGAFKFKGYYIPENYILLGCFLHYIAFQFQLPSFIALSVSVGLLFLNFLRNNAFSLEDAAMCLLILIYIPYLLFPIIHLSGTIYIYLVFIIAFSTDTFAYIFGITFGKHKLLPSVSPNKTVEGSIGGIFGSVIMGCIYFYILKNPITIYHISFFALSSISGQLGDLFASKIKRETGIKDYSNLLPGHGGLLDRFDSILLIIPMVYILYWLPIH